VVTLMALLSGHLRFATDKYWLRARVWTKLVATTLALAGVVYIAPQAWHRAQEFVWLDRAQKVPNFSTGQILLLKRAYEVEPKNAATANAIGEALRRQSQEGGEHYQGQEGVDYRQLAREAMTWFDKGMTLNRWESRNFTGYGWCLDWLDRPAESLPYFDRAEALDPNNYFNLNNVGLHYVAAGDYAAARPWFERSIRLEWNWNKIAVSYLKIIETRLVEEATNSLSGRLNVATP